MTTPEASAKKKRSLVRVGFSVLLSLTALIVLFVALTSPGQQGLQQETPPAATPATAAPTHDLAALLSAYLAAQPPEGLPDGLIDAAAKDACDRLSKWPSVTGAFRALAWPRSCCLTPARCSNRSSRPIFR